MFERLEATYSAARTSAIDVREMDRGRFSVSEISGVISSAVFALEVSVSGVDYFSPTSSVEVTGVGTSAEIDFEGYAFARVKVKTASSSASTAMVTIYAKDA